jgi:hypothetical protein
MSSSYMKHLGENHRSSTGHLQTWSQKVVPVHLSEWQNQIHDP